MKDCCQPAEENNHKKGLRTGILSGILPHSFCILFILFSVLGATGATALIKNFLIIPHFFFLLVVISLLFTTASAILYLHKANSLSLAKIKTKWKYLTILYTTTIATNLIIIFVLFPWAANLQPQSALGQTNQLTERISVDIPCTGHAPLIMSEIKQLAGIQKIIFLSPDTFEITYDPEKTSLKEVAALEIFNEFKFK
jgi:hypothetical protein